MSALAGSELRDELFDRVARGVEGSLDDLCRRYGPRITSIVRRRLHRALRARMESADVAQEVLLEIARAVARERFASEAAFLRWATVVVEHRILRLAKRWRAARRKIEREAYLLDGRLAVDPKAERPSKILERGEALERLSRALAELPAAEREVVVARVLLDLPWAQVAASLGITVAAGQMRLLRARRYLSTLLG